MAGTSTSSTGRTSPRHYPPELKQRAIRMVLDSHERGEELFGTLTRVANELGIDPEALRCWVHTSPSTHRVTEPAPRSGATAPVS